MHSLDDDYTQERALDLALEARGLPIMAFVDNGHDTSPGAAPVIGIQRGAMGYYPVFTYLTADALNDLYDVSDAQREAMRIGSVEGWDAPGAYPDAHCARTPEYTGLQPAAA